MPLITPSVTIVVAILSLACAETKALFELDRVVRVMEFEMSRKLKPVSPGEMLAEEFLKPLGMSNYRLAKEIGVPAQRIGEIIAGRRAITADTDLRLCRFFKLTEGWWLHLQADHDTAVARTALAKELAKIKPWSGGAKG